MEKMAYEGKDANTKEEMRMKLTSSAFNEAERIPGKFTCDGENINPELMLHDVPRDTVSVVVIMDDPDIPREIKEARGIEVFDHWVVFDIPVVVPESSSGLAEHETMWDGIVMIGEKGEEGVFGVNGRGEMKYTGPCPPPQYEPKEHRYFFKAYALDSFLELEEGASKREVEEAMKSKIVAQAQLMGRYSRG